jgi:hypothetical protein
MFCWVFAPMLVLDNGFLLLWMRICGISASVVFFVDRGLFLTLASSSISPAYVNLSFI